MGSPSGPRRRSPMGCVSAPALRISRRSRVHRPIIGGLGSPPMTPRCIPSHWSRERPSSRSRNDLGRGCDDPVGRLPLCKSLSIPRVAVRQCWADSYFKSSRCLAFRQRKKAFAFCLSVCGFVSPPIGEALTTDLREVLVGAPVLHPQTLRPPDTTVIDPAG